MPAARLPRIRLGHIDAGQQAIHGALAGYGGKLLTAERCRRLSHTAYYLLNLPTGWDNIFQTVLQLEGRTVDAELARRLSRQLAARADELAGGPIQLFDKVTQAEWVPLEIMELRPAVWKAGRAAQQPRLHCLAGRPAGAMLTRKVPESWLPAMAYQIGFSRRFQYRDEPRDLLGLRLWADLRPDERNPGEYTFEAWDTDAHLLKANKRIIKLRLRFELDLSRLREDRLVAYDCPFGLDSECYDCTLSVSDCPAAPNRDG